MKDFQQHIDYAKTIWEKREKSFSLFSLFLKYNQKISEDDLKESFKQLVEDIKQGKKKEDLDIYIHVPFCLSLCKFCMYHSELAEDGRKIEEYVDNLVKGFSDFRDVFKGVSFRHLYIGGGTPSILNAKQLEGLLKNLRDNFTFLKEGQDQTFELSPYTATLDKFKILKQCGVNRISFGVQSFHKHILDAENREYVSPEKFGEIISNAQNIGFDEINADLVLGLNKESETEIIENFSLLADQSPSTITVYTLQENIETSHFYKKGSDAFYGKAQKIFNLLIKAGKAKGYSFKSSGVAIGGIFVKEGHNYRSNDRYEVMKSSTTSILAFGDTAIGNVYGYLKYRNPVNVFQKSGSKYNAREVNLRDEMVQNILRQFQSGSFNQKKFKEIFDREFQEVFEDECRYLLEKGAISNVDNVLNWSEDVNLKDRFSYLSIFCNLSDLQTFAERKVGRKYLGSLAVGDSVLDFKVRSIELASTDTVDVKLEKDGNEKYILQFIQKNKKWLINNMRDFKKEGLTIALFLQKKLNTVV